MTSHLRDDGLLVTVKRIRRLMWPLADLPEVHHQKGHKTYPRLLRGLSVTRPNQVRAADVTGLPRPCRLLYLAANPQMYSNG